MESSFRLRLTGISSLLMHSDTTANPLDPRTQAHKKLTSARKKTEDQVEAIFKSEWLCSLYYKPSIGIYLPSTMLQSTLVSGGKLKKLGTTIQRGVMILSEYEPLIFDGPKDPDKLYAAENGKFVDVRSVVVQRARIARCRPIFDKWAVETTVNFDPHIIDKADIISCYQDAGKYVGIGDFRPQKGGNFGRYTVEEI